MLVGRTFAYLLRVGHFEYRGVRFPTNGGIGRTFCSLRFAALGFAMCAALGCSPGVGSHQRAPTEGTASTIGMARSNLRLVVMVVIDQLPAWSMRERQGGFRAGLLRLRDEGERYTARHQHAFTYTAAGHATLGTGRLPAQHGIIANEWYSRDERAVVAAAEHRATVTSERLRTSGLADWLRAAYPTSRSVAISLKPRAACFVTGPHPDVALWFGDQQFQSNANMGGTPSWVAALHKAQGLGARLTKRWEPLDLQRLKSIVRVPDAQAGESTALGWSREFPHALTSVRPDIAVSTSPLGDELVLEAGLAALAGEQLGVDEAPDLLALSFSAHDNIGHVFGQESWETTDALMRIDALLGKLFDALDQRVGRQHYAVVLSSDHGAVRLVESILGARRIHPDDIAQSARAAANAIAPVDVAAVIAGGLYFDARFVTLTDTQRHDVKAAAAAAIRRLPGIARAGDYADLCKSTPIEPMDVTLCNSYVASESPDVYVVAEPQNLVSRYTSGTHHDTPSADTSDVPLWIWRGRANNARTPAHATSDAVVPTTAIAPLIATLLGVPFPSDVSCGSLCP